MSLLHPISTLISDWSGVLSDDRPPVYEANMRGIEARGKMRLSVEEWLATAQLGAREFFVSQGITEDPEKLFDEYKKTLDSLRENGLAPTAYPDALAFLQAVSKRMRIIVLSAHPGSLLHAEAAEYGFEPYIAMFVGNLRYKVAAIENIVANEKDRKSFAYMGDTVFDVQAAKEAGVQSIGITTGYHSRERLAQEQPDVLADSLAELQEIIV